MSALQQATANAKGNAAAIAQTLNVGLGSPIDIGEDRLHPRGPFEQAYVRDSRIIEEISVSGSRRGMTPLMFMPKNIKAKATVWVRFELVPDHQ